MTTFSVLQTIYVVNSAISVNGRVRFSSVFCQKLFFHFTRDFKNRKMLALLTNYGSTPPSNWTRVWPLKMPFLDKPFYRAAFYRLVCKVVNLWDIDLKFLGSIFNVDIDYCAKFTLSRSYHILEVTFLETSNLSVFGLCRPIIYRAD